MRVARLNELDRLRVKTFAKITRHCALIAPCVAAVLATCNSAWAQPATGSTNETETVIRKIAQEFIGMLNTEDRTPSKRVEKLLADDFLQIWSAGRLVKGKKNNLDFYDTGIREIDDLFSEFTADYQIQRVNLFGDGAVTFGVLKMKGTPKAGGEAFTRDILETMVFRKTQDGWRLIEEHSTRATSVPLPKHPPQRKSGGR